MKEVIKIFEQIKKTSSLNEKKEIIKANKDNELFKECLVFLLDNNITTGLSNKKISKRTHISEYSIPTFHELMEYLKIHNTGTDEDISIVKSFVYNNDDNDQEFYFGIITKLYKLGADAKLVNDVIPGLIPTFDLMLGTPLEKVKLEPNIWISISRKLNGTRTAFVGNRCMTRQGKQYIGLDHIIEDLQRLGYSDYFVDGELLYKNEEGLSDSESFQKGSGIANSKAESKTELKLVVFDIFPLTEFWNGGSKETYKDRYNNYLIPFGEKIKVDGTKNLELVPVFYQGTDHSEIWKWLDYSESHDYEGCMLNLDTPYECKRTKNLVKVKKFFEISLRCTNVNIATTGKYKGLLGSITCKFGDYTVDCGSGFNDYYRQYYTDHPEEIVNHIVSIKYKEETTNLQGGKSLQFPVFCGVQFDRDLADDEV